jgi:hypothetical protein
VTDDGRSVSVGHRRSSDFELVLPYAEALRGLAARPSPVGEVTEASEREVIRDLEGGADEDK